ncbi:ACP S-malonyltransferase [Carnobacteriaceae bacterium zg-ZUI240]|nr:ACP S-malonyltransferase [Carnobacteriaceae bacterium zg-ZUI240]
MSIGFLFSGQGAQYENMGVDLAQKYEIVKNVYDRAQSILGYDVLALSQEQLNQTRFTQVAVFTLSTAIAKLLQQHHITSDVNAGLSLGEYSALVDAKVLSFEDGLRLLKKRGKFMEIASCEHVSGMLAVMNTPKDVVLSVCQEMSDDTYQVFPANYNMPGQIVISGHQKAVDKAKEKFIELGYKKCLPLVVSGAFHTPLMMSAKEKLMPYLNQHVFNKGIKKVVGNLTATDISTRDDLSDVLAEQIVSPVRFEESIAYMLNEGVDTFIEIGPKKVLSKFVQKINKEVTTLHVENVETFETVLALLQ